MADSKTFTQEEVDALLQEKLADAKAGNDKAFSELWEEAKQAKAKARAFDGLDPEAAKNALAELTSLKQQKKAEKAGISSEQLAEIRNAVRADLEKDYAPRLAMADKLAGENRTLKLDNVVKNMMGKAEARAERIDALYRLTSDRYDLTDDGKPMLKDRMGTPVEKYIAEDLRKEYPEFFQGTGSSGGGASKSNGGAGGVAGRIAAPVGGRFGDDFMRNLEAAAKGNAEFE